MTSPVRESPAGSKFCVAGASRLRRVGRRDHRGGVVLPGRIQKAIRFVVGMEESFNLPPKFNVRAAFPLQGRRPVLGGEFHKP